MIFQAYEYETGICWIYKQNLMLVLLRDKEEQKEGTETIEID